MKIKKLYIRGFKSFMDRLEINFPFGISGIVGPNGCGKSNIVDAIRWCMGEQSPKQLRGRRMEDVIFAGAGPHKPLGMAEVSILLENGNGTFPVTYAQEAELSVTRRLYRSGESEYLINKVPCRLKDIQEIFMDTGLGNKAYSIIGQGQIGTIIDQKPEDTRVMLEEAAGVTKYRKKVEASQRKIELTEANLQRVEDILGEVQRQMRSLKRQASRAKRYKSISETIQNLELTLYANTYHQFHFESADKLKSTEDLEQQEIAKATRFSQLHAQIETMNLELEEKDSHLSHLRDGFLQLKERAHKKETRLESLKGDMRMQDELVNRLRVEQAELRDRLSRLDEEKVSLKQNLEKMKERSHELEGEISLREKRLSARRELLKGIKEDYEKARGELSDGANKEMGLNHESVYLNKMLGQITDGRSRLEQEREDVKAKIETVLKASDRKNLAREATAEKLGEVEAIIKAHDIECESLEQTKRQLETDLKPAESDLNVCQSRFAGLQALTENFEGYQMGVRTIMKAKDLEPHQSGHIIGLLADIIQVDPNYEQAVEAVLADKLQYVIVQSQEDGKQAVQYLKRKEKGRSSFVAMKALRHNEKDKREHFKFRSMMDCISVQDCYLPLMTALLEDTVLVADLETALSAWEKNEEDLCFVTTDGDIVDRSGVISGGKLAQSSRGLLARKREMKELKKQSDVYQKKVDSLRRKLEHISGEIQEKKDALENLTEDKWRCQEEINEFDKALFRLGQELDQLEKLSQRISSELESKGVEQNTHKRELSRIEAALQERRVERQKEEEYLRKKELELNESQEEYDQFRDDLAKFKTDDRILREEQRSLVRELEMREDYGNDALKRFQKTEEEISLCRDRQKACQRSIESLNEELEALFEKLSGAETVLNRSDRERQTFQDRVKEEEDRAEMLREERQALKEEINRSKMEHSEIQFKMNNLTEIVREKFNRNLLDIYEQYLDQAFSMKEVERKLEAQKELRQRLGEVNLTAIKEHEVLKERFVFIKNQREDLLSSIESLRAAIRKINKTSLDRFRKTFYDVDQKLKEIFPILFNGGTAGLRMTDESQPLESGVLVEVQPPGKKLSHMGLLSGGEKALVAMALLFAIYMIRPSPFCLLDEVDAPLDEANIDRFNHLLEEIKRASQIIMVTHSRRTMEIVDRLYGVTMQEAGVSKTVSVDVRGTKTPVSEGSPNHQRIGR
ncbi:MAG: chromosome segregation protein SMC [Desulfatiglandaceae bacterium]